MNEIRVLANLSIGWKIFSVLSVLFVLVAGVSTSLISVLRQTDAQHSSLLSDDATVEQSTAASHSLAQDADRLGALTTQFNTGDEQSSTVHTVQPVAPGRKASRAAPVKGLRVLAGNAKRKPMADEQDWQEF